MSGVPASLHPTAGLTWRAEPSQEELWEGAVAVVESIRAAPSVESGIAAALDRIVEVLEVDRGLLVLHEPGGYDAVVHARADGRELRGAEREELSRSLVRRAREEARSVHWDAFGAQGAVGSIADLRLVAALAVPLWVGEARPEEVLGVLYVDVRDQRKRLGPSHERFLSVVACALAASVRGDRELAAAREALRRERVQHSAGAPPLWSLLAPAGMQHLTDDVRAAVASDLPVLLLGESGTGKTALAHAIARACTEGPVVRATLGMSDDLNTIISELFGHVRGAYSGASSARVGLVEHADGGCIVIDEILNMPVHAQQLLLDFTQFGTYRPLGWERAEPKRAKVRVLAATNGDVDAALADGSFRRDLYYRLAGIVLQVPPLRERPQDIPTIAEGILRRADPARTWTLSLALRRLLVGSSYGWPGNVRELEASLSLARQRALMEDPDVEVLDVQHVRAPELGSAAAKAIDDGPISDAEDESALVSSLEDGWRAYSEAKERLMARERALLRRALREEGGVVSRVARRLEIPRTTLVHRLGLLSLDPKQVVGTLHGRGAKDG